MATPANIASVEAEIQALVNQGQQEEARSKLFDLIASCARGGDLNNANRLRDLLYEVDPMALQDIIRANELIEEAMSSAVSDGFDKAWVALREALSEEEFLAFYHALEEHDIGAGKTVLKKGSKLEAILFINSGNLQVTCQCRDKTVEVKTLEPGTMISENCFQPSFWSVTVSTITPVNLSMLRLEKLVALENQFPGLEGRLARFHERFDTIQKDLSEQELDRRAFERRSADQKITFQVYKKDDTLDDRSFRGELINLSRGGLAFVIRIVKRENRRMLFGRRLVVTGQSETGRFEFRGTVVAVSVHDIQDHDYAVHVAFAEPVAEEVIVPHLTPEPVEDELPVADEPENEIPTDSTEEQEQP